MINIRPYWVKIGPLGQKIDKKDTIKGKKVPFLRLPYWKIGNPIKWKFSAKTYTNGWLYYKIMKIFAHLDNKVIKRTHQHPWWSEKRQNMQFILFLPMSISLDIRIISLCSDLIGFSYMLGWEMTIFFKCPHRRAIFW